MKNILIVPVAFLALASVSCTPKNGNEKTQFPSKEYVESNINFGTLKLIKRAYVPIYSHIYHISGEKSLQLTATLSIRNTSSSDSIYLKDVSYYSSEGTLLKRYLNKVVVVKPLSAIELVVEDRQDKGGAGASFTVDYGFNNPKVKPLIQAVMIGSAGQQGISFIAESVEVE